MEKKTDNTEIDIHKFETLTKVDFNSLEDAFEAHAGLSFEKQLIFGDIIGDNGWQLDLGKESILFGELEFPIQVIGSLSFNSNSWMWGWANTQSGIPESLLVQSNKLKEIGEEKNIKELIDGHFNVEEGFEYKMGMLASGVFNSKSYYSANYGQGTLIVTIDDNKVPAINKTELEKVLTCFPQLISAITVDHKKAFKNYLIDRDFKLYTTDTKIEGLKDGKIITAEFDDLGRLESLSAKL